MCSPMGRFFGQLAQSQTISGASFFLLSIMWKITILLCLNFILVGEIPMFDSIPNVEGRVFPVIALGIDSIFPAATMVKFQVGPRWSWMIGDQHARFFVGSSPAINEYRYGKFTICRSFPGRYQPNLDGIWGLISGGSTRHCRSINAGPASTTTSCSDNNGGSSHLQGP